MYQLSAVIFRSHWDLNFSAVDPASVGYPTIMSSHKKSHQHNNNNHHGLQQLAVGLQPLNLNLPDTPPVFTFTVMDYSSPEKPTDVTPTQVTNWYMRTDVYIKI